MPEPAGGGPVLLLEDLHAYHGDSHVLQGCTLSIGRECVTVLGRNGMGKTTLLRAIMGLTPPRSGHVLMEGRDWRGSRPSRLPRARHRLRAARPALLPFAHRAGASQAHLRRSDRPNASTPERVFELFPELAQPPPDQRHGASAAAAAVLAIGRALVDKPANPAARRALGGAVAGGPNERGLDLPSIAARRPRHSPRRAEASTSPEAASPTASTSSSAAGR